MADREGEAAPAARDAQGAAGAEAEVREAEVAAPRAAEHEEATGCVEINQCVGCTDNSSLSHFSATTLPCWLRKKKEPASPRHRAGVASMAWRTNAP